MIYLISSSGFLFAQTTADNLYKEAQQAYRNRQISKARSLIEEAIHHQSKAHYYYLSGLIYEAEGKEWRAVAEYETTLQINPEYREARFQKGILYLKNGDPSRAVDDFNLLIASKDAIQTRGVYFEMDPLGASQNQIVTLANFESRLFYYRGQAYEKLGEFTQAMDDYNQSLERDSIPDTFIARALLFDKMGNSEIALADLHTAIRLDPDNQLAWYNLLVIDPNAEIPPEVAAGESFGPTLSLLASLALESGDYEKAKKYFDLSLESSPNDPLTLVNRGRVLMKLEKYAKARKDFFEVRELEPMRTESLYLIGNSYFFEEKYEQALAYYNQYLIVDTNNASVWYNAAISYLELKQYDEACHYLQKSDELGMSQASRLIERYCD